ncbi:PAS domain-containing protein, partial [Singulisphaera rosea]
HTVLIARDGSEHPIDDSAAPIRDSEGEVTGAVLVFRDISERREAEIAQARLAAIVESSSDAIIGKDLDGTIQSWNGGAERVFGFTAAEVVGKSITLVVPPDRLHEEREILDRLGRGERIENFETQRIRKDGLRLDVALTISPIRDAEGNIVGASKIARDVTAAKRAERALASALQAGEVGTYYWDIKADQVSGDRNFVGIFGVLADEQASAPIGDFLTVIHPEDRDRVTAEVQKTLGNDATFRSEYRVVGPTGERWLLARGAIERAADGEAVGWAGVVVDITGRKLVEGALAASRARLDYTVQASEIGFWYCDLPFDVLQWDERVKAHFWLEPGAHVTIETFYDRIHPDDREPTRAAIDRSVAERSRYDVHYRTIDPTSGAEKWIRAIGGAAYDTTGTPKRFDGVTLDVTEQRLTEAALRESNDRFHIVARATNDAVWDWDMRTDTVWWNEGVTVLFGYRREEVGKDASWWYAQIHPDDRDRVVSGIHSVIEHGRANWSDEYRFRNADGTYAFVLNRAHAIYAGGKTIRLVGAMQDVTDRRRAEARLRESEQQYRTLFESIDEGFCVAEILFDDSGRAIDYVFQKVNPVFEQQTGLLDPVGKRIRELDPHHDEHWFEAYGRVAMTGKSVRFQEYAEALGRDFDVFAFRTGNPSARTVAMLFRDVTDRKRAEESVQFLADASASLAELVDYQSTLNRIANLAVGGFADWCVVDMIGENGQRERLEVTAKDAKEARAAEA